MQSTESLIGDAFKFENTFARLPPSFYSKQKPHAVRSPVLIKFNDALASELGLDLSNLSDAAKASVFAGNIVPSSSDPLAMVYAGHQFGNLVPRLGDGRALLLGELVDRQGRRMDVQLKGSGPTPYARMGDGRSWLGPVLREYVVSEAMHALHIPTTRGLAAVETGESVHREGVLPGAIFTRVSSGHFRVGTFQYFSYRGDIPNLRLLARYVQRRLYPDTLKVSNPPLAFLKAVVKAQAQLVAKWLGVGFIHGVMNTDNMSVAGETIDYGPCAFMDGFDTNKVFSSIDQQGRYAYSRQPAIACWNLAMFGSTLLPLISTNQKSAMKLAKKAIESFEHEFSRAWDAVARAKLGFAKQREEDESLALDFLTILNEEQVDFTHAFRHLSNAGNQFRKNDSIRGLFKDKAGIDTWLAKWRERLKHEDVGEASRQIAMKEVNPSCIPRNHQIEKAINVAMTGDYSAFNSLLEAVVAPFDERSPENQFFAAPKPEERVERTYCGT